MVTIETKYSIGDKVEHFTGVLGMITAIFHRSGKNSYEMSYFDDGSLSYVAVEECEISVFKADCIGFKRVVK